MASKEYLDRNLAVASCIGIEAGCAKALERLRSMKRPPKWLLEKFAAIEERATRIRPHLVAHRAESREGGE